MKRTLSILFSLLALTAVAQNPAESIQKVNSPYDDLNPVLSPDGSTLYFSRANHPSNIGGVKDPGDIWISNKVGDQWSEPVHAGSTLNDRAYNGVAGFSASGDIIFLLGHYDNSGRARTQGISFSRQAGSSWSRPENIQIPYFQNKSSVVSGSFSRDMRVFVFSAESYGTRGVEDIYVARKNADGSWGAPQNVGSTINTQFQEVCPSLNEDGTILYFSSNGRTGFGSFDVYESKRLDDSWSNWSEPINIGPIVNTEGREWYYREYPEGGFALYVSTTNSDGYGDIKIAVNPEGPVAVEPVKDTLEVPVVVQAPDSRVHIHGYIVDSKTKQNVSGRIQVRSGDQLETITVDREKGFGMRVDRGARYALAIEAAGYVSSLEQIDLNSFEGSEVEINYSLQPVERGVTVNLKNVLFEQSSTTLLASSYPELDVVVSFMKENPTVSIELAGHTDNRGNPSDNIKLSQERVDKVKEYLVSKGVEAKRITGKGYGGNNPIASNVNEETRKLNRRVEFVIKKL